jgi:ABC-type nitrate/sulfonate/bicarbonate transport system substrate-binding protein
VNKLKQVKQILTIILFFGFLAACSPQAAPTPALTPISIQLSWTHQSAFGGLYAADQNGYYAQEGLAVTLLQGGPTVDNIAAVQDGKAQFGMLRQMRLSQPAPRVKPCAPLPLFFAAVR